MYILKQLTFTLFFIPTFTLFIYFLNPFWQNLYLIFSLSTLDLLKILYLLATLLLTGLFFVIFGTLADDYKIVIPVILLSALAPIFISPAPTNYILAGGSILAFLLIFLLLKADLKTYLTFKPAAILMPQVKHLITLLILTTSIAYFFSLNQQLSKSGFNIPDSLIDTALQFSGAGNLDQNPLPKIDQSQINQLKAHPETLQQYGLDPSLLDQLNPSVLPQSINKTNSNNLIKDQVKKQISQFINPYLKLIPPLLAILIFFTLQPLASLLTPFLYLLVWLIFYILDKTHFTKYQVEMREVKKLVV